MTDKNKTMADLERAKRERQLRYEARTLNKPCSVRANPRRHDAIKNFAKTGKCNNCKEHLQKIALLNNTVCRQKNGPIKWDDQFTYRDAILSLISVSFVFVALILSDLVNIIFM